jgi:hypothetical protein
MPRIFKHILLFMVLAAVCYAIAVFLADGRLGFIIFFVAGLVAELVFWIAFWRQRRNFHHRRA